MLMSKVRCACPHALESDVGSQLRDAYPKVMNDLKEFETKLLHHWSNSISYDLRSFALWFSTKQIFKLSYLLCWSSLTKDLQTKHKERCCALVRLNSCWVRGSYDEWLKVIFDM